MRNNSKAVQLYIVVLVETPCKEGDRREASDCNYPDVKNRIADVRDSLIAIKITNRKKIRYVGESEI